MFRGFARLSVAAAVPGILLLLFSVYQGAWQDAKAGAVMAAAPFCLFILIGWAVSGFFSDEGSTQ